MIKKIPHLLPLHAKLILYIPLFDYGDTLWGDKNNDTFMGQLQVLQTRQPRFCFKINHQEGHRPRQCSYSFELFKFHDFFQEIFKLSKTLGIAISFKQFTNFPCFRGIFDLKQFNGHKLWCQQQCLPFSLFNYSSLSCIVLALASAGTNLSNKTLN